MRLALSLFIAITLCGLCVAPPVRAAEWQWSAEVTSVISTETSAHSRAFLWIPPNCQRVRAVLVGQHNMLEEGVLEHPAVRKALADAGMAAVWVSPALDGNFR